MKKRHLRSDAKRDIGTFRGYELSAVDDFAVRNVSRPDEEFPRFAVHEDFPDMIGEKEVWIAERLLDDEGIFLMANALARFRAEADGAESESAKTTGMNVERELRRRLTGEKYRAGRPHKRVPPRLYEAEYVTIPDPELPVHVWRVDGCLVRDWYMTQYVEGGHFVVFPWVPRGEIWVERSLDERELPFIVTHEYLEMRLMRDAGLEYDKAHPICSQVEYQLRKGEKPTDLLAANGRKLRKSDLPRLAEPAFYEYVLKRYVKG